jgi:hypothetical protein
LVRVIGRASIAPGPLPVTDLGVGDIEEYGVCRDCAADVPDNVIV